MNDGSIFSACFDDFVGLSKWMSEHHGEYTSMVSGLEVYPPPAQ